ncbi:MAG: hypothetical protein R3B70_48240 [Polyangiaceae bacterium]
MSKRRKKRSFVPGLLFSILALSTLAATANACAGSFSPPDTAPPGINPTADMNFDQFDNGTYELRDGNDNVVGLMFAENGRERWALSCDLCGGCRGACNMDRASFKRTGDGDAGCLGWRDASVHSYYPDGADGGFVTADTASTTGSFSCSDGGTSFVPQVGGTLLAQTSTNRGYAGFNASWDGGTARVWIDNNASAYKELWVMTDLFDGGIDAGASMKIELLDASVDADIAAFARDTCDAAGDPDATLRLINVRYSNADYGNLCN